MIDALVLAPAMAAINRLRGGGCPFVSKLPGHARLYAAALVGLVCAPTIGPLDAMAATVAYLAWSLLPWGRWYDLGALEGEPNRPMSWFEEQIARVSGGHDVVAFTLRNLIGLLPAALWFGPTMLALAPLQTAAYGIAWALEKRAPIRLAEFITGGLWGLSLAVVG